VLTEFATYDADILYVEDAGACSVPALAQNIWGVVTINGERIMYRERNLDDNTLTGLLRGTAGTAAADHLPGASVYSMGRESMLTEGYEDTFIHTNILSGYQQRTYSAPNVNLLDIDSTEYSEALRVYLGGEYVPSTMYTIDSPNPATITFYDYPDPGVEVTLGVLRSLSWYRPGPNTASNGNPLQVQTTTAARFLRGDRGQL
jgi:hypothetical protein